MKKSRGIMLSVLIAAIAVFWYFSVSRDVTPDTGATGALENSVVDENNSANVATSSHQSTTSEATISLDDALTLFELATSSKEMLQGYRLEKYRGGTDNCLTQYSNPVCAFVSAGRVNDDPVVPDGLAFIGEMDGKVDPQGFGIGMGWGNYSQGRDFKSVEDICTDAIEGVNTPTMLCTRFTSRQGFPFIVLRNTDPGYTYKEGEAYGYLIRQSHAGLLYYGFRWENGNLDAAQRFMEELEFVE